MVVQEPRWKDEAREKWQKMSPEAKNKFFADHPGSRTSTGEEVPKAWENLFVQKADRQVVRARLAKD